MHYLCRRQENKEVVETLIKHGARVNIPNRKGLTPLHMCCSEENLNLDFLSILLQNKADPNMKEEECGSTPFHNICSNWESSNLVLSKSISLFLAHKANPNVLNTYTRTPFLYAALSFIFFIILF